MCDTALDQNGFSGGGLLLKRGRVGNSGGMKAVLSAVVLVSAVLVGGCYKTPHPTPSAITPGGAPMEAADQIAARVMAASGAQAWPTVERIVFTYNVEIDGELVTSNTHDWNVPEATDTVTTKEGVTTTVALLPPAMTPVPDAAPGATSQPTRLPAEEAAFAKWTNDSYWLLMPLKLFDYGVVRTSYNVATPNGSAGAKTDILELSFQGVGLTPTDRYKLYLNPATFLPDAWDYMPNESTKKHFTWEVYQEVGPLYLSTYHQSADGKTRIYFTNLSVTTK